MYLCVQWFDIVVGIFSIVSGAAGVVALIIAIRTLLITNKTLKWFQDDRVEQDKIEFEKLIFDNIKAISSYCFDIAKINEQKEFIEVKDIKEAEQKIVTGFTYLKIYAKSHDLPDLLDFAVGRDTDEKVNQISFSFNFYELNDAYQKYRELMVGEPRDEKAEVLLNKFFSEFSSYITLATKYSKLLLNRKNKVDDEVSKKYYEKLNKLINYAKEEIFMKVPKTKSEVPHVPRQGIRSHKVIIHDSLQKIIEAPDTQKITNTDIPIEDDIIGKD